MRGHAAAHSRRDVISLAGGCASSAGEFVTDLTAKPRPGHDTPRCDIQPRATSSPISLQFRLVPERQDRPRFSSDLSPHKPHRILSRGLLIRPLPRPPQFMTRSELEQQWGRPGLGRGASVGRKPQDRCPYRCTWLSHRHRHRHRSCTAAALQLYARHRHLTHPWWVCTGVHRPRAALRNKPADRQAGRPRPIDRVLPLGVSSHK